MKTLHLSKRVYVLIAIILAAAVFAIANIVSAPSSNQKSDNGVDTKVSIRGKTVCLPHTNTDGPQTMECAWGLKAEGGEYYALKNEGGAASTFNINPEKTVLVVGTLHKETSTTYQMVGTITVSKITEQ